MSYLLSWLIYSDILTIATTIYTNSRIQLLTMFILDIKTIVQKNLLFRKGIGIKNFSGPSSYSFKRNSNYSFTLIPLKGKEYQHLPEF